MKLYVIPKLAQDINVKTAYHLLISLYLLFLSVEIPSFQTGPTHHSEIYLSYPMKKSAVLSITFTSYEPFPSCSRSRGESVIRKGFVTADKLLFVKLPNLFTRHVLVCASLHSLPTPASPRLYKCLTPISASQPLLPPPLLQYRYLDQRAIRPREVWPFVFVWRGRRGSAWLFCGWVCFEVKEA